jgi:hypothetical protein
VLDEPWPDEPDEPNPEDRWGDAERDLVRVPEAPEVSTPSASDTDVPAEVARNFWAAVVFANVGLFGVSLGAMLIGFRGQWLWGGAAVLVGALALVRTYLQYRSFVTRDD